MQPAARQYLRRCLTLLLWTIFFPSTSGWFYTAEDKAGDAEIKAEIMKNRQFPECNCLQKLRTNYFSDNMCGKVALCYWEIWNYKKVKAKAKNDNTYEGGDEEKCDKFLAQGYACLLGYPQPPKSKTICDDAIVSCNKALAKLLYDDCEELRKSRQLSKPQDIQTELVVDDMNLDLNQDENTIFQPTPKPEQTDRNNYYILSCPIVYRFPYFTIDLLFKHWDPTIEYDETTGLKEVAHMLPKFLREGINNERIQNFDALSLDPNLINWCNIPRNYICITDERDSDGKTLCNCNLCDSQTECNMHRTDGDCDFNLMAQNDELTAKGVKCPNDV
ncbi:hypothetical protein Ocin01_07749 [Orchesella cincta]|uniref:Uncharacterized protein n=1 Tax=Orchesella cincta TaxID=48709 RepID=A0A1D2N0V8_ORCCI|nr:hypothetical protein Ocin01_07749 [Orchesella cincta]